MDHEFIKLLSMTTDEFEQVKEDNSQTMHTQILISIIIQARNKGGLKYAELVLDRIFGKPKEFLDVEVTHTIHDEIIDYIKTQRALRKLPQ